MREGAEPPGPGVECTLHATKLRCKPDALEVLQRVIYMQTRGPSLTLVSSVVGERQKGSEEGLVGVHGCFAF